MHDTAVRSAPMLELEDEEGKGTTLASPLLVSSPVETHVQQTLNPDGSLHVKSSTITSHANANGYRDVKVEHFQIPAGAAAERVLQLGGSGGLPSTEYLSNVEYRILVPGHDITPAAGDDIDNASTYSFTPNQDDASLFTSASTIYTDDRHGWRRRHRTRSRISRQTLALAVGIVLSLAMIIGVSLRGDGRHFSQRDTADEGRKRNEKSDEEGRVVPAVVPDAEPWQPDDGSHRKENSPAAASPVDNSTVIVPSENSSDAGPVDNSTNSTVLPDVMTDFFVA